MRRLFRLFTYFTPWEWGLWLFSVLGILLSFFLFDGGAPLRLLASLVGVTSILLNAKGNPIGQGLMLLFSALYGILSFGEAYYGEMITYLGMTAPMALLSLITWLRHPYGEGHSQVTVGHPGRKTVLSTLLLSLPVTVGFYLILAAFETAELPLSTLSVATSFVAVALTFLRSPFFSLAYAANDTVLILLWIRASAGNLAHISLVVCFSLFLLNDLYAFLSWLRLEKKQRTEK